MPCGDNSIFATCTSSQNIDQVQAEHDIYTLETVIDDLTKEYLLNRNCHRAIMENAQRLINAADQLSELVARIQSASTARSGKVVELREAV